LRETKKLIGDSEEFRLNGAEFSGRNTGKTITGSGQAGRKNLFEAPQLPVGSISEIAEELHPKAVPHSNRNNQSERL